MQESDSNVSDSNWDQREAVRADGRAQRRAAGTMTSADKIEDNAIAAARSAQQSNWNGIHSQDKTTLVQLNKMGIRI